MNKLFVCRNLSSIADEYYAWYHDEYRIVAARSLLRAKRIAHLAASEENWVKWSGEYENWECRECGERDLSEGDYSSIAAMWPEYDCFDCPSGEG